MTDLTFNGGMIGAQVGNQQFTMRNMTFNNCVTAISQIWNWGWVYQVSLFTFRLISFCHRAQGLGFLSRATPPLCSS